MSYPGTRIISDFLDCCASITQGSLRVITPQGHRHDFGRGRPQAELRINDWAAVAAFAARGDIGLGESYVLGLWDTQSVEDLGQVVLLNRQSLRDFSLGSRFDRLRLRAADRLSRGRPRRGCVRDISALYTAGNEFYQLWLDPGMTYSSALFAGNDDDLQRAQNRKHDRILDLLGPGERVLDIGCAWGAFAERAAGQGRQVTAVTTSANQRAYADARLDGRARVALGDFRETGGRHDCVVSVEVVEALGQAQWPAYFATIRDRLADGGRAVIQAITVPDDLFDGSSRCSGYLRRHVLPGGMLPGADHLIQQARFAGLSLRGSFAFGQDYARTCRHWASSMQNRRGRIMSLGFTDAALRAWQYHLGMRAASFATGNTDVVQFELARV